MQGRASFHTVRLVNANPSFRLSCSIMAAKMAAKIEIMSKHVVDTKECRTRVIQSLRPKISIAAFFVVLPAVLFYAILLGRVVDIPYGDDYEAILEFVNRMTQTKSLSAKSAYFLSAQFNEYKLFFEHAVVWAQYLLLKRVDITSLCLIGNGFVALLAILLWKMCLPDHKDVTFRLATFIPVSWLLFQLQYVETLNWAMASLQNVPVIVFSLCAIYLLVRGATRTFYLAILCLVLAVASSGNGLLLIPVGVLILAQARQYKRALSWAVVSIGCVAAYFYHYDFTSSLSRMHQSVLATVLRPRPFYLITFIGNMAAFPFIRRYLTLDILLCPLLGLIICAFAFAMLRRGFAIRNPLVCYSVLFLLLTAIGVAGLRSDFGVEQSLSSRYGIYSALFVIFAWYAIVEEVLLHDRRPLYRSGIWLSACAIAILFSLTMDAFGWLYLGDRNQEIFVGMAAYERPVRSGPRIGPVLPFPHQNWKLDELDRRAPQILAEATRLGIYRPPQL